MPIAYSCPHCGKQYSVAEQYAGQTGPCASCGKPITIPLPAGMAGYAYAPQPAKSGIAYRMPVLQPPGYSAQLMVYPLFSMSRACTVSCSG